MALMLELGIVNSMSPSGQINLSRVGGAWDVGGAGFGRAESSLEAADDASSDGSDASSSGEPRLRRNDLFWKRLGSWLTSLMMRLILCWCHSASMMRLFRAWHTNSAVGGTGNVG